LSQMPRVTNRPKGTDGRIVKPIIDDFDQITDWMNGRFIDEENLATKIIESLVPAGAVLCTARATADAGYLLCDGAAVSRTTYSKLFAAIGTAYGVGDGTTTFNLPDLRGRTPVGAGQGSGLTARAVGQSGGGEAATIERNQMWRHLTDEPAGPAWAYATSTPGPQIYLAGGGGALHDNMQPYTVVNYQIKT
jgi:microcystin-dependent protein